MYKIVSPSSLSCLGLALIRCSCSEVISYLKKKVVAVRFLTSCRAVAVRVVERFSLTVPLQVQAAYNGREIFL
jgi:hypothetical protein